MPDYYVLNSDGTTYSKVTHDDIRKNEKWALESDVQTVKVAAEQRQSTLESQVTEFRTKVDEMTTRATTAETALSERNAELEPLKLEAAKVSELTTQITALTEGKTAAETQALTVRRNSIIDKYNLPADKKTMIEGMNAEQLTSFEQAASILPIQNGNQQQQQTFDRGRGGNVENGSAFSNIKAGLSELETVGGGGNSNSN